jgi:hypothetical protein
MRSQVHVKVEAFTAGELAVRAQQEGVANLRPDEAEDANEARLPVSCQASTSVHVAVCEALTVLCILQDGTEEAAEGATPSLQELGCTFSLQVPHWHDQTSRRV